MRSLQHRLSCAGATAALAVMLACRSSTTIAETPGARCAPASPPQLLDVRGLRQWRSRVLPEGASLVAAVEARLAGVGDDARSVELTERYGYLLFDGSDATVKAVARAVDALRHDAGVREVERARQAITSLRRDYAGDDAAGIQIKLTWTGPQTKPVPGLAIHSAARIFDVTPFRAFRRRGIPYGNDDLPVFRSFAAPPDRIVRLVRAIVEAPFAAAAAARSEAKMVSATVIDTTSARRPNYVELLLDRAEAAALVDRMITALDASDPTGAAVLEAYRRSL